jgi:hypothetical protein
LLIFGSIIFLSLFLMKLNRIYVYSMRWWMSEASSIWVFMQRPNIINLDATYWHVCVVNVTPRVMKSLIKSPKLKLSLKARENKVIEVWNQNSKSGVQIQSFKFSLVWTDWLSQKILRIYWSWTRPWSQKRIWSSWVFIQVCKSTKIIEVIKYLFQACKHN